MNGKAEVNTIIKLNWRYKYMLFKIRFIGLFNAPLATRVGGRFLVDFNECPEKYIKTTVNKVKR